MLKPYIGICDFTNQLESRLLLKHLPSECSHALMVGVMMSYKSLNGLPTKWTNYWPDKRCIGQIFVDDDRLMNTIHYADYKGGPSRDLSLASTLERVAHYGGVNLDALQLDMIWPDPIQLQHFRSTHDVPIVLQVGSNAMTKAGNTAKGIARRIRSYGKTIDYVLLDQSMGEGKAMNVPLLLHISAAVQNECPNLGIAVAGGLGPTTLGSLEPLLHVNPMLSWDAQSRLRTSKDKTDPINWKMAESYLRNSLALLP